jgi:UDP-2,3-diacylglucosamine hydrolase
MTSLFVSDLHLKMERPDITRAFVHFLENIAPQADALYLLGDIFEVWIGDDAPYEGLDTIIQALSKLSQNGCTLFFQHGNRDFLVGKEFLDSIGAQLLPEILLVDLPTGKALVMHGDQLCTDDLEYQNFRQLVRNPQWQSAFLSKPIPERVAIAKSLRDTSKKRGAEKDYQIMDVNPKAVLEALSSYQTNLLIHGHTHRPAVHSLQREKSTATRIVLGDWDTELWYLLCDQQGNHLIHQPIHP